MPALSSRSPRPNQRAAQRDATRALLLKAAVAALIENGVAGATTLEVQRRAGVSRGALLHHFPTHADLLSATVAELVRRNEETLWREQIKAETGQDPLAAAIRTLAAAASTASYVAELELWAMARTDAALRETLRQAERQALKERERVLDGLFAAVRDRPGYELVLALSIEFVRGLALSDVLRTEPRRREQLLQGWIAAAATMIDRAPDPAGGAHGNGTEDVLLAGGHRQARP